MVCHTLANTCINMLDSLAARIHLPRPKPLKRTSRCQLLSFKCWVIQTQILLQIFCDFLANVIIKIRYWYLIGRFLSLTLS